jgi:hypothetical protein
MASIVWSDRAGFEDRSRVEDEFLVLMLILGSTEESGSKEFRETNLFLGFEKTCIAEPVFCSMCLNDCIS